MEIQSHTHNPIAETAIMALRAHPELLPSFMEEIEDYLFGQIIKEGDTEEYVSEKEIMDVLKK